MSLSPETLERHKRHLLLKEIGGPGLQKLRAARVSIIGAGALGGPCALYLAAAGVGEIELWDDDTVDRSNLQRQIQFADEDIGAAKAEVLAARLRALNPDTKTVMRQERFGDSSVPSGKLVIDASDNFETRFALNAYAHRCGCMLVSGAASRWDGQVSVFASGVKADTPCYRCFVPELPPEAEACDEVGVVGALTGQVGAMMALEAVKVLTGAGDPLIGRLCIIDGLGANIRTVKIRPSPDCSVCGT